MSYVMGPHSEQRDCCFAKKGQVRVNNEAAIVLEKWALHWCRNLPPGLGGDRSGIVLWGERRKGGVDFVIGHRHRRSGCAKGEHDSKSDRGLGRHSRGSSFEMSALLIYNRVRTNGKRGYVRLIHDDVFDPLQGLHVRRRYLRALNAVAAGSNVGRMGGNTTHEVSSNQKPQRVADRSSIAVGPVRRARRGNIAITSIGQTRQSTAASRQSAAASRQSAAATVEWGGGVRGLRAGRSREPTFPSPGIYGLRESRCS